MAVDHAIYEENTRDISIEDIRWAWDNYFVSVDEYSQLAGRQSPDTGA
jgi:hypothetical protein